MLERRWEQRLLCADLVQVEWRDRANATKSTYAILEDISRAGACLQTDEPLPVEGVVQIHHGNKTLEGTVSYCAYREIGYFAGITFSANHGWSKRIFRPKHLVDLDALKAERGLEGRDVDEVREEGGSTRHAFCKPHGRRVSQRVKPGEP